MSLATSIKVNSIKTVNKVAETKKNTNFFKPFLQPKLTINQPNDIYEQEADAVAKKVMRMPDSKTAPLFFQPKQIQLTPLQRKCAACEEDEKVQMKEESNTSSGMTAPSSVNSVINSLGQKLDAGTRGFMESRFGYDFGNVQIHNDSSAHQSSSEINALAYTHGNHVVFGEGQYRPNTNSGKQLMAHELVHVVQQSASSNVPIPTIQMQKASKRSPSKRKGNIIAQFQQEVIDLYIWPNALGSIGWVKNIAVGQEVWDQLIKAGVNITILFVAEKKDIPVKKDFNALGFTDDSGDPWILYVLVGQPDYYYVQEGPAYVQKERIIARSQDDIADTLFHELLHAWFKTYIKNTAIPSGHTERAVGIDAANFDPKEYAPEFLDRWRKFRQEFNKKRAKP
jgi:hypothetical protein